MPSSASVPGSGTVPGSCSLKWMLSIKKSHCPFVGRPKIVTTLPAAANAIVARYQVEGLLRLDWSDQVPVQTMPAWDGRCAGPAR